MLSHETRRKFIALSHLNLYFFREGIVPWHVHTPVSPLIWISDRIEEGLAFGGHVEIICADKIARAIFEGILSLLIFFLS